MTGCAPDSGLTHDDLCFHVVRVTDGSPPDGMDTPLTRVSVYVGPRHTHFTYVIVSVYTDEVRRMCVYTCRL